jgi:hypothetical protein
MRLGSKRVIGKSVLDLLKDVDNYTAATGVALAHKVLEHKQTRLIYGARNS